MPVSSDWCIKALGSRQRITSDNNALLLRALCSLPHCFGDVSSRKEAVRLLSAADVLLPAIRAPEVHLRLPAAGSDVFLLMLPAYCATGVAHWQVAKQLVWHWVSDWHCWVQLCWQAGAHCEDVACCWQSQVYFWGANCWQEHVGCVEQPHCLLSRRDDA
ncbi:unnamed protein product [Caenorhabditis bovis]|uniref:Uncharacterized protein n=1 Tax=Caenorhabditis bovis TaxID=2654633 RepID=A0A8S1EF75_9PELO|nr:unnamed protein product [Caenorhabditis bovis]